MRQYVFSSFSALNKSLARSSPTYTRSFCSSRRVSEENSESSKGTKSEASLSSCTEGTVLVGLNYLKGQPPVVAKKDEEYPPWLWDLLKPKVYPDDGPGGKGEKMRLRAANRQKIKEQNFLKTQ